MNAAELTLKTKRLGIDHMFKNIRDEPYGISYWWDGQERKLVIKKEELNELSSNSV